MKQVLRLALVIALVAIPFAVAPSAHAKYLYFTGVQKYPSHQHRTAYRVQNASLTAANADRLANARRMWATDTPISFTSTSDHAVANISVYDGSYGDTGWLGVAVLNPNHDNVALSAECGSSIAQHCNHSHIKFNLSYYPDTGDKMEDAMVCQELGHLLALDHEAGDCMGAGYFSSWTAGVSSKSKGYVRNFYNGAH